MKLVPPSVFFLMLPPKQCERCRAEIDTSDEMSDCYRLLCPACLGKSGVGPIRVGA